MKKIFTLVLLTASCICFGQIGFQQNTVIHHFDGDINPNSAVIADIDGDGKPDILRSGSTHVVWQKNLDGQGNFGRGNFLLSISLKDIQAVDIDNDNDLDVFGVSFGDGVTNIVRRRNLGGGVFEDGAAYMTDGISLTDPNVQYVDVNGDNALDIIYNDYPNMKLLMNNGQGQFLSADIILFPTVDSYFLIDFTGDGKPDLVTDTGYDIKAYKNNGFGSFILSETMDTNGIGNTFSGGDIDGDGDNDILYMYQNGNNRSIKWYKNNNGVFANGSVLITITSASTIVNPNIKLLATDVDGDSKVDIICATPDMDRLAWYKNLGNATFGPEQVFSLTADNVSTIALGDIDGNGKQDLVSASPNNHTVAWYKNTGAGFTGELPISRTTLYPNKAVAGDLDGDGDPDLAVSSHGDNKVSWIKNPGGNSDMASLHQIVVSNTLRGARNVNIIDIDKDGDFDITAESWFQQNNITFTSLVWFKNNGSGSFIQETLLPNNDTNGLMSLADIDNDGDTDIVTHYGTTLNVLKNNGSGAFSAAQPMAVTIYSQYTTMLFDYVDTDAILDMILINNSSGRYFKGTGQGNFATPLNIPGIIANAKYKLFDRNGDGHKDLMYIKNYSSQYGTFYKNPTGNFNTPGSSEIAGTVSDLYVHDLNNDGSQDLILSSSYKPLLVNLYGYGEQMIDQFGSEASSIGVADFNGDGNMDIFTSVFYTHSVNIYKNMGPFTNTVTGIVRLDADANTCTPDDPVVQQILVTMQNGSTTWSAFTNANGNYSMIAAQGTYTTSVTSSLPNFVVTPQSQQSEFTNNSGENATANFCLQPTAQITDLEADIFRVMDVRPGFPVQYKVVVKNTGTVQVAGAVTVNFDDTKLNFNSVTPAATSQTANTFTFDLGNMLPFAVKEFILNFTAKTIPTINLGDNVVLTANATVTSDATPANNTATDTAIVVGSYDPNDIAVREGSQILLEDADEYLHYLIRFQNTGNYYAERVVVKNPIDSKLDWTSMQLESMSHAGRVEIINGTEAIFTFDAIYLPASEVNEPASHGYIAYKIKPKTNVQLGDTFTEQAHIFFDFNPAIDTNVVTTTVTDNAAGLPQFTAETVSVYPVPSKGMLNVKANTAIAKIEIYNQAGQCVLSNASQSSIDISGLGHGIYFAKIEDVNGSTVTKKAVKN
jgi:hypothetical protein